MSRHFSGLEHQNVRAEKGSEYGDLAKFSTSSVRGGAGFTPPTVASLARAPVPPQREALIAGYGEEK